MFSFFKKKKEITLDTLPQNIWQYMLATKIVTGKELQILRETNNKLRQNIDKIPVEYTIQIKNETFTKLAPLGVFIGDSMKPLKLKHHPHEWAEAGPVGWGCGCVLGVGGCLGSFFVPMPSGPCMCYQFGACLGMYLGGWGVGKLLGTPIDLAIDYTITLIQDKKNRIPEEREQLLSTQKILSAPVVIKIMDEESISRPRLMLR